jgi:hypothetical protein
MDNYSTGYRISPFPLCQSSNGIFGSLSFRIGTKRNLMAMKTLLVETLAELCTIAEFDEGLT